MHAFNFTNLYTLVPTRAHPAASMSSSMASHSQDLTVLARVKKKKRKVSPGQPTRESSAGGGTPFALFIQSTLKEAGRGEVKSEGEERGRGGDGGGGGGGGIKGASGARRQRGSSSRRKKSKFTSRELRGQAAVRFPGFDEDDRDDSSDISVYSESGSEEDGLNIEGETSADIEEDVEGGGEVWVGGRRVGGKERSAQHDRKRRKVNWWRRRAMTDSAPGKHLVHSNSMVENIQEFDSLSSESSDTTPPHLHYHKHTQSPPLPPLLHTSTPTVPRHTLMTRGFPTLANTATTLTPEYMSIATPPSSPEIGPTAMEEMSLHKTKASDWIKQIPAEPADSTLSDMTHLFNDSMMKTPHHSHGDRGRRGRGRGRRVVPGGLAEQLQQLDQRESSEVTFWEHKAKRLEEKDVDLSSCLTVHVYSLLNCYSLSVAKCRTCSSATPTNPPPLSASLSSSVNKTTIESGPDPQQGSSITHSEASTPPGASTQPGAWLNLANVGHVLGSQNIVSSGGESEQVEEGGGVGEGGGRGVEGGGEVVTVLFSMRCTKYLGLQVGSCIRIHPPWQCLSLPPTHHKVILCTHFCQTLGISSPPPTPSLPTTSRHRREEGLWELSSPEKSPTPHHSALTRSPAKCPLVPTRLFPSSPSSSTTNVTAITANCLTSPHTSPTKHPHNGSSTGQHSQLLCHPKRVSLLQNPGKGRPDEACTTQSPTDAMEEGTAATCTTLLEAMEHSTHGVLSVVGRVLRVYRRTTSTGPHTHRSLAQPLRTAVSSGASQHSRWCVLLCDVSGMFCELQLSDTSQPSWLDVVEKGEGRVYHFKNVRVTQRTGPGRNPELFSLIRHLSFQLSLTSFSSEDHTPFLLPSSAPSFCYVLVSPPDSIPLPWQGEDPPIPNLTKEPSPSNTHPSQKYEVTRVNLYAQVVCCLPEVVQSSLQSSSAVTPSNHPSLTPHYGHYLFVTASPSTLPEQSPQLTQLYVKPQFPRAGLDLLLTTPGERMLLRDVERRGKEDTTCYLMDVCSMVFPLNRHLAPSYAELNRVDCSEQNKSLRLPGDYSSSGSRQCPLEPVDHMGYPKYEFKSEELSVLHNLPPPTLPHLTPHHEVGMMVSVSGKIVGIDEETAFSWPTCDRCGNNKLGSTSDLTEVDLYCDECKRAVTTPNIHLQLAVYIQPSNPYIPTICAELQQSSIKQLLPISSASMEEGFDVHDVLNRAVCLNACFIQEVKETPRGTMLYLQEVNVESQTTRCPTVKTKC